MDRVYRKFAESLRKDPDRAALHSIMQETAHAFDLSHFAYLYVPREANRRMELISNYPADWTSLYMAQSYDGFDPVIRNARLRSEPFEWDRDGWPQRLDRRQSEFMEEAAGFGIGCGFTFPLGDPASRFAAVTFAADSRSDRFYRSFTVYRDVLKLIAYAFHAEARTALAPRRCVAGVMLTSREFECLGWAARGKSAWDTGRIIGISSRTITFHLHNAKRKLGVRTVQQAVGLFAAARRGNS